MTPLFGEESSGFPLSRRRTPGRDTPCIIPRPDTAAPPCPQPYMSPASPDSDAGLPFSHPTTIPTQTATTHPITLYHRNEI